MIITAAIPELAALERRMRDAPEMARQEMRTGMQGSVLVVEAAVADRAPVDTSRLRNAIASRVDETGDWVSGFVEIANLDYAVYQEWGTGRHTDYPGAVARDYEIVPRSRKALAFTGADGARVVRRKVKHPGVRPKRFFRDGWADAEPQVRQIFRRRLDAVTRYIAGR